VTAPLEMLRELQTARGLLPDEMIARRARAILDRADLGEINVVEYLKSKGYTAADLYRAAGSFGSALAVAYFAEHGVKPIKADSWVEGIQQYRMVNTYIEADRDLIERTFAEWSA